MRTLNMPVVYVLFVMLLLLGAVAVSSSPEEQEICGAITAPILTEVGNRCAGLSPNTACFGNPRIDYTRFTQTVGAEYFTRPGDRADLITTQTIQTGALNGQDWGVAVMNVQANLPSALGTGVIFIATGGVEVENGVDPAAAVIVDSAGVEVTTGIGTDLLSDPPARPSSEVIGFVPRGTALMADAVDETGEYTRVVYQRQSGWVARAALDGAANLSSLPILDAESFAPMQSFYFRVGIGGTTCAEAESLLFIQGPANTPVNLRVHQHDIQINSAAVLRTLPPGDELGEAFEVVTLYGVTRIHPGAPDEVVVAPGYRTLIPFCDAWANLGIEGDSDEKATCGSWSQPEPLTLDELASLNVIAQFPPNIVNLPVTVPNVVSASGTPATLPQLIFFDPDALGLAQAACAVGELSVEVCGYLGLQAFDPEVTCAQRVSNIFDEVAENCAGLGANSICYGYRALEYAQFSQHDAAGYFSEVGDVVPLTDIEAVRGSALDVEREEMGVIVLNIQANLPLDFTGDTVLLFGSGNVEFENGVEDEIILQPGISTASTTETSLLTNPAGQVASTGIGTVPAGASVSVDAVDETGTYVRVLYNNVPGWIERSAVDAALDLSGLPVIGAEDFTPMQSFYFRSGINDPLCVDYPAAVVVKSPQGVPVDLRVNSHDLRLDSTALLRTIPPGDELGDTFEVIAVQSDIIIHPGAADEVVIPAGYSSSISFCDGLVSLGVEGDADEKLTCGAWTPPQPLTVEQLRLLRIFDQLPPELGGI